jgi:hypothetical protein
MIRVVSTILLCVVLNNNGFAFTNYNTNKSREFKIIEKVKKEIKTYKKVRRCAYYADNKSHLKKCRKILLDSINAIKTTKRKEQLNKEAWDYSERNIQYLLKKKKRKKNESNY